jgi:protein-tyrosine phosphatase
MKLLTCAIRRNGFWEFEEVNEVLWVERDPAIKLAIVLCPRGDDWLKDDLRYIKRAGVDTLVSLLEPQEAIWLGLGDERQLAEEVGLSFLSYPIRDVHVPADMKSFRTFCAGLADRLRAGEHIGLHCRGSIGRAPTTAACTLIHLGWKAKDALGAIQKARGFPIPDTEEQLRWILNYNAQP